MTRFLRCSLRNSLSSKGFPSYRRARRHCLVKLLAQESMILPCVLSLVDQTATAAGVSQSTPPNRLSHSDGSDHPQRIIVACSSPSFLIKTPRLGLNKITQAFDVPRFWLIMANNGHLKGLIWPAISTWETHSLLEKAHDNKTFLPFLRKFLKESSVHP